jgi:hypothetical protein
MPSLEAKTTPVKYAAKDQREPRRTKKEGVEERAGTLVVGV